MSAPRIVEPITLRGTFGRLEPLSREHEVGLMDAVSDGELWKLWYTNIPTPEDIPTEIERRLALQVAGSMLPFTVFDPAARIVGMTTYMNIDARKRVARLMKAAGLRGRCPPRWVRTTTPEPTPPAISDLVHGQFEAPAPDVLWVGDITYIRTWEGWLYLLAVIDVFSRRVIGFSFADHMRPSLLYDALQTAVATRGGNVDGVILHSDRGSQCSSVEFRALCDVHGTKQSMGKTRVCWDNALAESFFATCKLELIEPRSWPTRARTRTATVLWIEAVYDRQRRHSAIDMMSAVDYEDRYWKRRAAA